MSMVQTAGRAYTSVQITPLQDFGIEKEVEMYLPHFPGYKSTFHDSKHGAKYRVSTYNRSRLITGNLRSKCVCAATAIEIFRLISGMDL